MQEEIYYRSPNARSLKSASESNCKNTSQLFTTCSQPQSVKCTIIFSAYGTQRSCKYRGSGTMILLYTWSYRNLNGEKITLLTAPKVEVSVTRVSLNDNTCRRFMNCNTEIPVLLPPELIEK